MAGRGDLSNSCILAFNSSAVQLWGERGVTTPFSTVQERPNENSEPKKFDFFFMLNKFHILEPNVRQFNNCASFKIILSIRNDHCDYSLGEPKNLVTPFQVLIFQPVIQQPQHSIYLMDLAVFTRQNSTQKTIPKL